MRRFLAAFLSLSVLATAASAAPSSKVGLIRDAEIEATLRAYSGPLLNTAGLSGDIVKIHIVDSADLNAFVAGGPNLFVNTGLLRATEDIGELMGVLAHEIGHIAGGHIIRGRTAQENASAQAILSAVLGVAAAIATGEPSVGAAVTSGGQQAARNTLLGFSRTQESAADSAALRYLEANRLSARGMLRFLERLEDQELLPASAQDPLVRTHPLTRDRVDQVRAHVAASPYSDQPFPEEWADRHARMVAKLVGFQEPQAALRRYAETDRSVPARYARAIAYYRRADLPNALPLIDALLAEEPSNPWFWELKGQMLFENGHAAEALGPYRRAVGLAPDSGLLRIGLGQVLLALGDAGSLNEALAQLQAGTQQERDYTLGWRLLATAYGRLGDIGMSALALAEEALARNDTKAARDQARRAESLLPVGSPGGLRAQDIIGAAERAR